MVELPGATACLEEVVQAGRTDFGESAVAMTLVLQGQLDEIFYPVLCPHLNIYNKPLPVYKKSFFTLTKMETQHIRIYGIQRKWF